jgi:hypothetical protein
MATPNLSRFEQFLAIPTEDIAARAQFAFSHSETDELHTLAVNGEASWDLYHQVNNAQKADFIYRNSGQERGWNIGFIREQLGRTADRHYSEGGEDIHERISGRLFPKGWHIERRRSQKDPLRITHEVELAFSSETDLEELWTQQRLEFEQEGIELLQQFPDSQFVQDMCFLPVDQNMEVRFIISAGARRKELIFPIALRYRSLVNKMEKKYKLDVTEAETHPDPRQPLQGDSTEERQEALAGLWSAVQDYNESMDIPIPAYIKKQLGWHMGERFDERSIEINDPETGKTQRVLQGRMERTGGLLDDPRYGKDGTEAGTLGDTIADPHARLPDQGILLQQILDSLVDKIDRQIVHLYREGQSQEEIAKKLKITQPAIAKRLKRIGRRFSR